jgi:hypothetical protein
MSVIRASFGQGEHVARIGEMYLQNFYRTGLHREMVGKGSVVSNLTSWGRMQRGCPDDQDFESAVDMHHGDQPAATFEKGEVISHEEHGLYLYRKVISIFFYNSQLSQPRWDFY